MIALIPPTVTLGFGELVGLVAAVAGVVGLAFFVLGVRFESREEERRQRLARRYR